MPHKDPQARKSYLKRYRELNKRGAQARELRRNYSLSIEKFEDMADRRGSACPICLRESKPYVDHCHKTGFIRGLLCSKCNLALGLVYDSPETLRRMADYIEKANDIADLF